MKATTKNLQNKSIGELTKDIDQLRQEILKVKLEKQLNPPKDTNVLFKKKKQLSVLLTIISQKQDFEELTRQKN